MGDVAHPTCDNCGDEQCSYYHRTGSQTNCDALDWLPVVAALPSPGVIARVEMAIANAMRTEDGTVMVSSAQVSAAARAAIKAMGREVGP